ncbi:hypothetical protein [Clostridium pasteurianum]|uniref:Uncharacterized protein n=1 Tax=Clostridium pasteurianum BC1 TaxID=86416 RepID=R4K8U2_CLOPA|nr:hypothetical protein [Clostridium pasteurianum]AGK96964.1 hypothetical protein Clopa_2081 [Clostridium pasteurianum BC1]
MSSIGKKITVIGSPGSGKSTFSKKLTEKTGISLNSQNDKKSIFESTN